MMRCSIIIDLTNFVSSAKVSSKLCDASGRRTIRVAKANERVEENTLFVKNIVVDSAVMAKRLRTAPQGRGYRIRKRSNHVTLVLDKK